MRKFPVVDEQMIIGGEMAVDLAERYGTPVYVTDERRLRENYRRIHEAFNKHMPTRIHYACKANANLALLRVLEQEGSCIDAVSLAEVEMCLKAGFSPSRILYTGTGVSNQELQGLVSRNVPINLDSLSELRRLAAISEGHPVSIRVNPNVGAGHHAHVVTGAKTSKFGIPKSALINAYAEAISLGLKPFGLHAHIGAGVQDPQPFVQVTEVLIDLVNQVEDALGLQLQVLDMGGGIGIPYRPHEQEMDVELLAEAVTSRVLDGTGISTLAVEPGRYIVADSTVLLTRVVDIKETPERRFASVDAGFNTLIRPAFYGSYHHVLVANKMGQMEEVDYDVVGPICESGDFLAHDRRLPRLAEGDLLAVLDAGAYGYSMSSNYNCRGRAAEVLVKDGQSNLIREAETVDDLLRGQKVPSRLIV